jgi:AraC-like DNA-binding protein
MVTRHSAKKMLSDIAYSLGYADQSHFIRDFRFFTGSTPREAVNEDIIFPENEFASNPNVSFSFYFPLNPAGSFAVL